MFIEQVVGPRQYWSTSLSRTQGQKGRWVPEGFHSLLRFRFTVKSHDSVAGQKTYYHSIHGHSLEQKVSIQVT